MLNTYVKSPKSKLRDTLDDFASALKTGRFFVRKDLSLVFLCGANQSLDLPSARRQYLKKAIEQILPHTRIIYAEAVVAELLNQEKKTKNVLDIENKISAIADWIIIVLESNSAFTELGAFSSHEFRKKLFVINDSKFKDQPSFINVGPIQALREASEFERDLWYPMKNNGITVLDGIGQILPKIIDQIKHRRKRTPLTFESFIPKAASQSALFFLHDLIYMCGPVTHKEIIEIYKSLLDEQPFDDISQLRGILLSSGLINSRKSEAETIYESKLGETFIEFPNSFRLMLTGFRRLQFKYYRHRFQL